MPHDWNNILVVKLDELVPSWFTYSALQKSIKRHEDKPYGIKRVQRGCYSQEMLISFDSLPTQIKEALGDPRKLNHILEKYYTVDGEAVSFYSGYKFEDGTYLDMKYQERYIINSSVIKAVLALKEARETERLTKGTKGPDKPRPTMETLCADAISFNKTLWSKYQVMHTLPENIRRFNDYLKGFQKEGYSYLISDKHKNSNARKVDNRTLKLLNNMFADSKEKPTATEIFRRYSAFLSGYLEVINNATGELYNPKEFESLSDRTVTEYLIRKWENKIATYSFRSGDRQKLMQQFRPYHSLMQPEYAGSIISVDDRQPPFKTLEGNRIWFYNAIDLASEAFVCWVYGTDKKGIIIPFYQQLVRNYAEWNLSIPDGLEAELSLNSSLSDTLLREGNMFQAVRIEANNARGKRIEAYYRQLRYEYEKDEKGWLARPHAKSEANQQGQEVEKVARLPYDTIVETALRNIEEWNNTPHSQHKEMTRWEYFIEKQNPNLKPTNWRGILPYIGWKTKTSCNVGIIRLQRSEFLLGENGKVSAGESLISLMKQVEGREIDVYWLDGNDGQVLKALVYIDTQYICEAVAKPIYSRAKIEQTPADKEARNIMSKYVATIDSFAKRQKNELETVTIIDNTPLKPKSFVMPGLKQRTIAEDSTPEILPEINDDVQDINTISFNKDLKDRF